MCLSITGIDLAAAERLGGMTKTRKRVVVSSIVRTVLLHVNNGGRGTTVSILIASMGAYAILSTGRCGARCLLPISQLGQVKVIALGVMAFIRILNAGWL